MSGEEWAARFQDLVRAAAADGYELWLDDEQPDASIEIRLYKADDPDDDGALILEWNA